jgi:repressor LexA
MSTQLTELNEVQQKCFEFISTYIQREGLSPSYREIMTGVGIKSPGHLTQALEALVNKNFIRRRPATARGITLVEQPSNQPETT